MSRVLVNLSDDSGELGPADLPAEAPAQLVVSEIVELLDIGTKIAESEPADHQLLVGGARRRIHPGESLARAGVRPGDTLTLSSVSAQKWLEGRTDPGPPRNSGLAIPAPAPAQEQQVHRADGVRSEAIALRRKAPSNQSRSKGRQLPPNRKTVPLEMPNSRAHPAGSSTA